MARAYIIFRLLPAPVSIDILYFILYNKEQSAAMRHVYSMVKTKTTSKITIVLVITVVAVPGLLVQRIASTSAQSLQQLEGEISQLEERIQDSRNRLQELRDKKDTLKNKLEIIRTDIKKKEAELRQTRQEIASTEAEIRETKQKRPDYAGNAVFQRQLQ
ncbi:hypothetical protein BRC20_00465 [Candidatus Saccharibacteria bacterium QS_8_54_8]|nr:MAG: hypothetical protein BRC20_00465 [Candidatus Saccharibacteria bacterium QS_8_54_8]